MTFEPHAFEQCKDIIKASSPAMCSPHYSDPCSNTCLVCNMDKNVYDLAWESIQEEKKELRCKCGCVLNESGFCSICDW